MVEDLPCFGRPSTSNTDENVKKVKEMVLENRHASLRELSILVSDRNSNFHRNRNRNEISVVILVSAETETETEIFV